MIRFDKHWHANWFNLKYDLSYIGSINSFYKHLNTWIVEINMDSMSLAAKSPYILFFIVVNSWAHVDPYSS